MAVQPIYATAIGDRRYLATGCRRTTTARSIASAGAWPSSWTGRGDDRPGRHDAGRAGDARRARRHARVRAGRRGERRRPVGGRPARRPPGHVPEHSHLPAARDGRRTARPCSRAGGRWARGSIATSRACGLRRGTGSSRRGRWSTASSPSSTTSWRGPMTRGRWPGRRPPIRPGWSGAERDRFAAAIASCDPRRHPPGVRTASGRSSPTSWRRSPAPTTAPGSATSRAARPRTPTSSRRTRRSISTPPRSTRSASTRSTGSTPSSRSSAASCSARRRPAETLDRLRARSGAPVHDAATRSSRPPRHRCDGRTRRSRPGSGGCP